MNCVDIIVPVKNESATIDSLVMRIKRAMDDADLAFRIIFIDDHSTDESSEIIKKLQKKYPILLFTKTGRPGKAFSILQGIAESRSEYLVMLDADLEYPPEAIPKLFRTAQKHQSGVVVAKRQKYKRSGLRTFVSKANTLLIGRVLFGFKTDIQSGLKLFRRDIVEHLDFSLINAWSFDLPLLHTARELGMRIDNIDIAFDKRTKGDSKIKVFEASLQVGVSALRLRLKKSRPYLIRPKVQGSMEGAGIIHKRKRFITHTVLGHERSAMHTFSFWQKFVMAFVTGLLIGGVATNPVATAIITVGILSLVYFLDVLFSIFLLFKSLHNPPEIQVPVTDLANAKDKDLPMYTILCPLYREAHVLPQFIEAMRALSYPKEKLDVILLLEEDDQETIRATKEMFLPAYMRVEVVPDSLPKTKPKACNYGLAKAKGDYIVIYDAEDIPDPLQLKKAYLAFKKAPSNVFCLQAKLNYYNPQDNLLTKLFTAEYSLWFDVLLPGLQSIESTIPLGGTSNHFKTENLRKLHGWDPFNVTEDCDLGVRLFKDGFTTAIIDSTTLEEANSSWSNWLRQRSRWLKGYLQTYLVHMRKPFGFMRDFGIHAFIFQLVVGGKIVFMLINPLLWLLTISYFALYAYVGTAIETIYPNVIFYMAAFSLVVGNFLYLYNYMIGTAKREHWTVVKYVFVVPFYWLMVSVACVIAVWQLITRPHYWEKTHHGLHLQRKAKANAAVHAQPIRPILRPNFNQVVNFTAQKTGANFAVAQKSSTTRVTKSWYGNNFPRLKGLFLKPELFLIIAGVVGNFMNFLYNAYLGRVMVAADFGLISLFGNFLYLTQVPLGALSKTVTYGSGFLFGRFKEEARGFWRAVRVHASRLGFVIAGLWLIATPLFARFFQSHSFLPFIIFTPVWLIGALSAVDIGFLSGSMRFQVIALLVVLESMVKFAVTFILVQLGLTQWVYTAIPISQALSLGLGWYLISRRKEVKTQNHEHIANYSFPKGFYAASVLSRLSLVAFISFDVILAKHYLSPQDAGAYALLSLVGKMIFFVGSLFSQFIVPYASKESGEGKNTKRTFTILMIPTLLATFSGFVLLGLFGDLTVPLAFGDKVYPILNYLPLYTLSMVYFTIATNVISYHQVKKRYIFPILSIVLTIAQIAGIMFFHSNISQIVLVMFATATAYVLSVTLLHFSYDRVRVPLQNVADFFSLFTDTKIVSEKNGSYNILVMNWRDTKHSWAGGAEAYVHELSKQWVADGHSVTVFCGNDGKSKRNELVDGVRVVRRGGFYTVYFWAAVYYVLRFRDKFDVLIDSENGLPFFTPIYARIPKFLLIHHVHQNVFREHLPFPLSTLAVTLETKIMPLVYHGQKIITVSNSSRNEIVKSGLGIADDVVVIPPGIARNAFARMKKDQDPHFVYVGRLKPYKNIDVLLQAFQKIQKKYPVSKLTIAGDGESKKALELLTRQLSLNQKVSFLGRVSNEQKREVLARAWALIQPSSFEGWGMTVIEANAAGTPVIASKVNGLKDSVVDGKTGLLAPVKDSTSFAKLMTYLIEKKTARERLSKEAYMWAQEFNWEESAAKFNVLFQEALHDHSRPHTAIRRLFARKFI
ncbi:glycosyltransferase [Candidatus Microgenomates bacterium]|nr:MAG: glycosyltransferase [Candidatus Microgenomates bacterium]